MTVDTRWNNPGQLPMTNGPFRAVTPPRAPVFALEADGKEIEFLLPFPMHIVDADPWVPLEFAFNGVLLRISKPIPSSGSFEAEGRVGNETPDAFCTIILVRSADAVKLGTDLGWSVVEDLLQWIRIKCRHYWLLHGITGYGAVYRSTVLDRSDNRALQKNVVAYGRQVIVRPLTQQIWLTISEELENGVEIPLSESLYCDALLSTVAGDHMKTLVEAGVAAEVAITQLLLAVSGTLPDTTEKKKFRKDRGDYDRFKVKLTDWPQRLGLQPVQQFQMVGIPNDRIERVEQLYTLRNGIAHSGKIKTKTGAQEITSSLFAVNALLQYCREQRNNAGLKNYAMPGSVTPFSQTLAYWDGLFTAETNSCEAQLGNQR